MLFSITVILLMFCGELANYAVANAVNLWSFGISTVDYTWENQCPNANHSAEGVCLFDNNIPLQCRTYNLSVNATDSTDIVKWTLYPHNASINSSKIAFSNNTSSISFSGSQESVFFLVTQSDGVMNTSDCLLCNISLDTSRSTSALIDVMQSYCK